MIKNLLFDLGGVIMNIRRQNCVDAFVELGLKDADSLLGEYSQSGVFAGIENGSLTPEQFHAEIRSHIGHEVSDEDIDRAFGCFLIGIPLHRLRELEALHSRYGIYMLSNTNPIMWADGIRRSFEADGHNVDYYFDGIVRSYMAHSMKPDERIFRVVIDRYGLDPQETLFLDDSQTNLDAAARLGFHTLLVPPGQEFYDLLSKYPGFEMPAHD